MFTQYFDNILVYPALKALSNPHLINSLIEIIRYGWIGSFCHISPFYM